jgi:nitrogenase molybdenum-iron protein alpha/beta subunit
MISQIRSGEAMDSLVRQKIGKLSVLVEGLERKKISYVETLDMHQFCAFWGAYDVLSYLSDAVVLVHGASGCLGNSRFLVSMGHHTACDLQPHYSTDLHNKDIIFGGEKKLLESILELQERHDPPLVFILTNCCVDIIGDDVEGCLQELPEQVRAKVICLRTGGFSGKSFRKGTDSAFEVLGALAGKPGPDGVQEPDSVNLFLRRWIWEETWSDEVAELESTFKLLGVRINRIFQRGLTLQDLLRFNRAQLNVALCSSFSKSFLQTMESVSGMPFVESSYPVGLLATITWLEEIAHRLGRNLAVQELPEIRELARMRAELMAKLGEGRHCVIWAYKGERTISLVKLAKELGMIPIVVNMEPAAVADKMDFFQAEIRNGLDVDIFVSSAVDDVEMLLATLNSPIVFCNDNLFDDFPVVSYRFAYNQIYGLAGTRKLYGAVLDALAMKKNKYLLFLKG